MYPILVRAGDLTVYSYGVAVVFATIVALWWATGFAPRHRGVDEWLVFELIIVSVVAGTVSAKLGFLALGGGALLGSLAQSGGSVHLGLLGGFLAGALYLRWRREPYLRTVDGMIAAVPLAMAIGRLGCFAAGCCHGRPTVGTWGLVYSDPVAMKLTGVPLGVALHATPLYFAVASLVTFLVVREVAIRCPLPGSALFAFLLCEGMARLVLEPFRGDQLVTVGSFSVSRGIAAGFVGLGLAGLMFRKRFEATEAAR